MHKDATQYDKVVFTAEVLRERLGNIEADDALILGSGLGAVADTLTDTTRIPYDELPNWPVSGVEGHAGTLVYGKLDGIPVLIMQGRAHYYEGWAPEEVTFPIRVFAQLGIKRLLVTNSAGGVNPDFSCGDLMLISDHINLTGFNPLRGANDERFGPRFPDMTHAYAEHLRDKVFAAAAQIGVSLRVGVYAGLSGPSYETPAEITMLGRMGADAVGMSTVPEVIVASHAGLEVAGISCITNMAAGISPTKLNHDEVKDTADRVQECFIKLVHRYLVEVTK